MKEISKYFYIAFFFGIILTPSIALLIENSASSIGSKKTTLNDEKRKLTLWPEVEKLSDDLKDYTQQINQYLEDRIIFREVAINSITDLRFHILNLESDKDAFFGNDGWLFFREGISNAIGLNNVLVDEHFVNWATNALEMKKRVEQNGGVFLIVVPPDKAQVYPEYLNKQFRPSSNKRPLDRLKTILEKRDILVVDLLEKMMKNKSGKHGQPIYFKTDTHWTHHGALLGYQEIISKLNSQGLHLESVKDENLSKTRDEVFSGDLAHMLGLTRHFLEFREILRAKDSFKILSPTKTLLIYGDSFNGHMQNFWPYSFKNVKCIHHNIGNPNIELIDKNKADVVILEIVERNLVVPLNLNGSKVKPCT